ncbi:hypothetical protein [Ideonella sp. YS5]|uniref:hypothetical protein n=1 Tax=Ideonella sp. YS5 TaxID=3453714 RepID=UPI003F6E88DD
MRFNRPPVDHHAHRPWGSARFTAHAEETGTASLLPPLDHGRSDRFSGSLPGSIGGSGYFEIELDHVPHDNGTPPPVQSTGQTVQSNSAVNDPASEVVIDIDPPVIDATPRGQIEAVLHGMDFAAPEGPLREAQVALEAEYITWAAGVAEKRQAAFGAGHYSIGGDHQKNFGEAVLPAVYDFARQFISSSSRSPVRNAVATEFAPNYTQVAGQRVNVGEFSNGWDSSVVGGALGGVTAHAVDSTLLTAMDREAKKANMPQLKPVDLKALVPDPGDVQLSIVEGKKVYWRPTDDVHADLESGAGAAVGHPSKTQLQEEVKVRRQALASVQDGLEAKNWGLFAQPMVTGAFNVLRRVVMPASSLLQPGPVFIGSVVASGTAGAVTKLGLGLLKPTAQADVDNLVGGQQHVKLFATKVPDASLEPARFSDIGHLPGRAKAVLGETAALGAHFLAGAWRDSGSWVPSRDASLARIGDVMRSVTANTLASVLSTATGPLVASVARQGLTVPAAGEAKDSGAYLLQQAATSATNDYVWQASKEAHKNSAFDLAGSLDRWRARTDR